MKTLRSVTLGAVLLALPAPSSAGSFRESFDQPGGDLAPTRFSVVLVSPNTGIVREPLTAGQGAPSTGGVLPVDEGGDSELRFFEAIEPYGFGYVLTPEQDFTDVTMDGYIGIGYISGTGVRTVRFLLRATGSTPATLDAYYASFTQGENSSTIFAIGRIENGIVQLALVRSDAFDVVSAEENYRVIFRAQGDQLRAELWRVVVVDGEPVETPVDLETSTPEVENVLVTTDGTHAAGAVGFTAFLRSTNSVFVDDVVVLDQVFDDGFESGDTSAWTATQP